MISYNILQGSTSVQTDESVLSSLDKTLVTGKILWIDVTLSSNEELEIIQNAFSLDPYAIEDVVTGNQRPKIEDYGAYTFSVIKTPEKLDRDGSTLDLEELFLFLSKKWIITVHRKPVKIVETVYKRVKVRGVSPFSKTPSTDLLYYMLLDNSVDSFYPILYTWDDELDKLDEEAVSRITKRKSRIETVREIGSKFSSIRSELSDLRNTITPTRDILSTIMKGAVPFVQTDTLKNFRDIYDHTFQLIEMVDSYISRAGDIRSLYLNLMSAMTNEILRLLTIVATIFLPLSLLASVFGTNFTSGINIPLTHLPYGFYIFVTVLFAIGATMIILFRRNGWV